MLETVASDNSCTTRYDDISGIDYSEYPFPNELWLVKPAWEIAVKTAAFIPIVVGGIWGNAAVLHAICSNRIQRSTPTNIFIANMALCDLCALIIGPWMLMVIDSFQSYILGPFFCKTEGFVQSTLLLGGVFSLAAISCDRLVAIVFPRRRRLGLRAAWAVVALTWCAGIAISVPLVIFRSYNERQWCNFLECYCTENTEVLDIYWSLFIALLVWFPLLVMLLCYSAIFIKLQRYNRAARKNPALANRTDFRARVTRMVLVLILVFLVCRIPFTALIYVRNAFLKNGSYDQISEAFLILWFVSHYLIYANAAINPIIYGMTNEALRPHSCLVFNCCQRCTGRPSPKPTSCPTPRTPAVALQPREPYLQEPCWRPARDVATPPFIIDARK